MSVELGLLPERDFWLLLLSDLLWLRMLLPEEELPVSVALLLGAICPPVRPLRRAGGTRTCCTTAGTRILREGAGAEGGDHEGGAEQFQSRFGHGDLLGLLWGRPAIASRWRHTGPAPKTGSRTQFQSRVGAFVPG
jgi:hypothetical protein